jgi:hypothetical protein
MTEFENVLETILEEYARRDSEGEFDTWEETDVFVKEKAEVLLAYANIKEEPVSENYHERYKNIAQSESFKKAYEGKSVGEMIPVEGEEPVCEDLQYEIANLGKRYPEVSFAKLSRIAVHMARWQKQQMMDGAVDGFYIYGGLDFVDSSIQLDRKMKEAGINQDDKVKVIVLSDTLQGDK